MNHFSLGFDWNYWNKKSQKRDEEKLKLVKLKGEMRKTARALKFSRCVGPNQPL
jgi:hypothetical protein